MDFESQTFDTATFLEALASGDPSFESCEFAGCVLEGASLHGARFIDCTFSRCALLNVRLEGVAFRDATFRHSKLQGLDFSRCNAALFEVRFEDTSLSYCVFQSMDARRASFASARVEDCEFVRTDLRKVVFEDTTLRSTRFDGCNLAGADLRTASQYAFDPSKNKVEKARVASPACAALLLPFGLEIDGVGRGGRT